MTTKTDALKRSILSSKKSDAVCEKLQSNLTDLIDLALVLKQAHWNVLGNNFRSVHLQLDEVHQAVTSASDEVAERISTMGISPDGRAGTVAADSQLETYPMGFQDCRTTVAMVADAMKQTIQGLRQSIEPMGELDPITEDLLIGITATLEKYLWMVQAQEA